MGRNITNNGSIEGDCITGDTVVNILFQEGKEEANMSIDGLSARLYKAMQNRRMSASKLEKKLGISKFLICEYIDGTSEPSLKNIVMLANCLGVSLDWLVNGKQDNIRLEKRIAFLEKLVLKSKNDNL